MSGCASRSEHDLARRSVLRAARLADRRIRCWSPAGDYYCTEERLLWTAQHGDVVPRRVRDEAEATLLAYHGARLWWALEPLVSWRRIADCHQEALIVLLEVLRSGQVDAVSLRRRVPALAFEVACQQVLAYGGDATGGQR